MSFLTSATVAEVVEHSATAREYRIVPERPRKYEAGSFLQLTLEQVTPSQVWPDSRTFSIASYGTGPMTLIIQKAGSYTSRIFDTLRPGVKCTIKYPFGELFDRRNADQRHVFIAGGLGVTPFLGLLDFFRETGGLDRVDLLYSVKREADLLHADRIRAGLGERARFFVTRESTGRCIDRRICLQDMVEGRADYREAHYYVCGSKEFNAQLSGALAGVGCGHVHMDEWE